MIFWEHNEGIMRIRIVLGIVMLLGMLLSSEMAYAQPSMLEQVVERESWMSLSSDKDKAKAVFEWMCAEIGYDVHLGKGYSYHNAVGENVSVAERTLEARQGVCLGYASLYVQLCRAMGIRAMVVEGLARSKPKEDSDPHAWVVVELEDGWHITDPTWGAGVVVEGRFEFRYAPMYFLMDPEDAIKTHYPLDPVYQLVDRPISYSAFHDSGDVHFQGGSIDYATRIADLHSAGQRIDFERSWKYHPEDPFLTHNYAVALMDSAAKELFPCIDAFNADNDINKLPSSCKASISDCLVQLEEAIALLDKLELMDSSYSDMVEINGNAARLNHQAATVLQRLMGL